MKEITVPILPELKTQKKNFATAFNTKGDEIMKKLLNAITAPFASLAVLVDESRNLNDDGSWDTYWAKKNCKAELRELRDTYRKNKTEIKNKWRMEK